jgi:hypothetical protein
MHVKAYVDMQNAGQPLLTFLAVPRHRTSHGTCPRTIDGHMIGTREDQKDLGDWTAFDVVCPLVHQTEPLVPVHQSGFPWRPRGAAFSDLNGPHGMYALKESNSRDTPIQKYNCILPTNWCRNRHRYWRPRLSASKERSRSWSGKKAGNIMGLSSQSISHLDLTNDCLCENCSNCDDKLKTSGCKW